MPPPPLAAICRLLPIGVTVIFDPADERDRVGESVHALDDLSAADVDRGHRAGGDGRAADTARGDLVGTHGARGNLGRRDRTVRHATRHQGVTDGGNALVGAQLLNAIDPVIEPDAQPDVGVGEHRRRDGGGHVRDVGVAEQHGVQALGDREGHGIDAVAPVRCGAVGIDQGELELPRAVEVRAVVHDAALIVDDAGHLGVETRDEIERTNGDDDHEI